MINKSDYKDITSILRDISQEASNKILEIYHSDFKIAYKNDRTPLTKADTESNKIICSRLGNEFPNIPIISEENKKKKLNNDTFFLVDPLDGTKEFIARNGEFTVNIGLMVKNKPTLGIIQIPVKSTQYFSDGNNSYKYKKRLKKILPFRDNKQIKIVVSRSHLDLETKSFIKKNKNFSIIKAGSSLKFCLISEGKADIYIRNGKTMWWDVAAGIALIKTTGSNVKNFSLKELKINKHSFKNEPFICFNNKLSVHELDLILRNFIK